ncbi:MAG: rhodanese-like domain-containing protein [Bacteroidota bacterium]
MEELQQQEWKDKFDQTKGAVLLDVRRPDEWEEGIIPGAMMINLMDTQAFVEEVEKLDKSKAYFIYCRSGNRSGQACRFMSQQGFTEVYNLLGGMLDWKGEVGPPIM